MSGSALPRVLIIMPHLGDGGGERLMLDLLVELRRQGLPVEMLVMQRRGSRVREAAERGVDVDYGCGARQGVVLHGPHIFLKALMAAKRSDLVGRARTARRPGWRSSLPGSRGGHASPWCRPTSWRQESWTAVSPS